MMQRLFKTYRKRTQKSSEHGGYLVIMVSAFVVILGLAALGLDAANLYHAKMQLRKAADAAVLGGLGYRIQEGPGELLKPPGTGTRDAFIEQVKNVALDILVLNYSELGLNIGDRVPAITDIYYDARDYRPGRDDPSTEDERLTVNATADVPLLLMNLIPFEVLGAQSFRNLTSITISAVSTGSIDPAYISLMLDNSGSMACPADDINCPCAVDPTIDCDPSPRWR